MVIILLSGLSQAGTAWLRVAELNDPREYFRLRQNGWVGGPIPCSLLRWKNLSKNGVFYPNTAFIALLYLRARVNISTR